MRSSSFSRLLVAAGALAAAVVTAECAAPDASAPPGRDSMLPLSPDRAEAAVAAGLTPHGLAEVNWMAEIHTEAMQEVLSIGPELKAMNARDRCARVAQIVRKFVPDMERATGVRDQAFYEVQIADALWRNGCGNVTPLPASGLRPSPSLQGEPVTGQFRPYALQMETAVLSTSSPAEAAVGIDAALAAASAAGLRAPDFKVLAGIASIAASSTYYWHEVEMRRDGSRKQLLMSIYPVLACGFWCRVGWGDVAGTLAGALVGAGSGPEGALGGALVGAVVGSSATALAQLM